MFRMAKLRTSCKFTKGVSGRFVVTNKWHYWVQSALHGIRLYAQSGSDEIDQKWNDQIPSKEVTRSGKALIDRFSTAILPDFGKFCHFGEILKSLAKAIEWVILCLAKVWTYFGNFFTIGHILYLLNTQILIKTYDHLATLNCLASISFTYFRSFSINVTIK